ncbi:MAG: hypothetical protein WCO51_12800 [bacterium]|jgi:hypothetical protein
MKKNILPVLTLCLAVGCGKPVDFSNNQYREFLSVQELKSQSLRKMGFRVDSLDTYLPLPSSAKNISVCQESGIDLSIWWAFDVSKEDLQEIEKISKGNDPCPFYPNKHDITFWFPQATSISGVHLRDAMTWIGVDLKTKRVYCLKYTM